MVINVLSDSTNRKLLVSMHLLVLKLKILGRYGLESQCKQDLGRAIYIRS